MSEIGPAIAGMIGLAAAFIVGSVADRFGATFLEAYGLGMLTTYLCIGCARLSGKRIGEPTDRIRRHDAAQREEIATLRAQLAGTWAGPWEPYDGRHVRRDHLGRPVIVWCAELGCFLAFGGEWAPADSMKAADTIARAAGWTLADGAADGS